MVDDVTTTAVPYHTMESSYTTTEGDMRTVTDTERTDIPASSGGNITCNVSSKQDERGIIRHIREVQMHKLQMVLLESFIDRWLDWGPV